MQSLQSSKKKKKKKQNAKMTMRKKKKMMIRVARLQDTRERNRKTNEKNVDDSYKSSKRLHSNTKHEEREVTSRRSMTMKMRERDEGPRDIDRMNL